MKINFFIFLFLIIFNFFNISIAAIKNDIVVKIENRIITNHEIKNKILSTIVLSNREISQKNINQLKEQSLDFLIQLKVKKTELSKYNFIDDENQIQNYLRSISSNNVAALKKKFSNNNLDFNLFLDEIKTELKWQKLIYKIYSNKIEIDENMINQELQVLINSKSNIEEYKLSEIEIFIKNNNSDQNRIKKIEEQINKTSFDSVALEASISSTSSDKGNLGWINGKSLNRNIYNVVKKMRIGEVSEPIKRQNTILFLKLNDKKISKLENININDLKKRLVNQKRNELFNLYSKSHLSKLKNTSMIEYK
jgi:peptidyl-prolyl cis-trans isomerase SurA